LYGKRSEFNGHVLGAIQSTVGDILLELEKELITGEFLAQIVRFRGIELDTEPECVRWFGGQQLLHYFLQWLEPLLKVKRSELACKRVKILRRLKF
jgi:hypothetical protein